jgi:hypothetical protein
MFDKETIKNNDKTLTIAVIVAIILGIGTSFFFLIIDNDSYTAIYIVPDSIFHDSGNNSVLYTYGVTSFESGKMDYTLDIYLDDTLIRTRPFSLNKGEILDERDKIILPDDITYPTKISLTLTTKTSIEEVHFWLTEQF